MTPTFLIVRIILVSLFGLAVFGFFRFVNKQLNELKPKEEPSKEPFTSFGWVFFKNKSSLFNYAYNAVEKQLVIAHNDSGKLVCRHLSGENINTNIALQKYLFDKAKGIEFTFKTISRDEFMSVYNNK